MKCHFKITTGAKQDCIEFVGKNKYGIDSYKVKIKAQPIDGKGNIYLIDFLANYFNKPKRKIQIISGFYGKEKIVEIIDN